MTDQLPDRPLTLGTAGHIDHGKTTLIKALTGRDTDRLKEEKERGISIELGFAELTLPGGRHLSVVDVPGHERFVKTMVAGATGIDLFMLVVASDDGVMPQTREHMRIIELLGIPLGLVALTKIDMVDEEMVELVQADIEDFLAGTPYPTAPVVPVSGVTGAGLPDLLATLDRLGAEVPPRPSYPATRLPVDRVFSLKGIGTVVTGTLWSGSLAAEDTVVILPPRAGRGGAGGGHGGASMREVRVRSVQVHDRDTDAAAGGQRVALSLTGVERDEVERGQWVVKDPAIDPTYLADVRLSLLSDAHAPLPRVSRVRVDHGTAELLAKVVLADQESLLPGESCYAQVRFDERALVYPGDRFIVRSVTPVTTIGGGRVIDPAPRKHSTGARWHERLSLLEQGAPDAIVTVLLEERFPLALTRARLEASPYLWRFATPQVVAAVAGLLAGGRALPGRTGPAAPPQAAPAGAAKTPAQGGAPKGTAQPAAAKQPGVGSPKGAAPLGVAKPAGVGSNTPLFHGPSLLALTEKTLAALRGRAENDPLNPYLTLGDLRRDLTAAKEAPALDAALDRLLTAGEAERTEHGYRWAQAATVSGGANDQLAARLLEQFTTALDFAESPLVATAAEAVGLAPREAQKLIDALVRQNKLVKVGEDLYYPPDRLAALMDRIAAAMETAGQITLAEVRDLLSTSRRFSQALLEHMDSEGLTLRVGEARRLRRRRSR